jgi:hypothetical protein
LEIRLALERSVLRALCTADSDSGLTISDAKALLAKYVWRDADHRVVFESLCGLPRDLSRGQLREQLPAQATRLGFPDVDWEKYLKPIEVDTTGVRGGISRLLAME